MDALDSWLVLLHMLHLLISLVQDYILYVQQNHTHFYSVIDQVAAAFRVLKGISTYETLPAFHVRAIDRYRIRFLHCWWPYPGGDRAGRIDHGVNGFPNRRSQDA